MAIYITNSEKETRDLAALLAGTARAGTVFARRGDLGAGKSAFARGFIQSLAGDIDVPSPTFTLVQAYDTPRGPLYHFDLYRLNDPDEVVELGWEYALNEGICLIEWPQRAGAHLPASAVTLDFMTLSAESRKIEIDDAHT